MADIAVVRQVLITIDQSLLIDADFYRIADPDGLESLSAINYIVTDLIWYVVVLGEVKWIQEPIATVNVERPLRGRSAIRSMSIVELDECRLQGSEKPPPTGSSESS